MPMIFGIRPPGSNVKFISDVARQTHVVASTKKGFGKQENPVSPPPPVKAKETRGMKLKVPMQLVASPVRFL